MDIMEDRVAGIGKQVGTIPPSAIGDFEPQQHPLTKARYP
jgi:hypothetical protein